MNGSTATRCSPQALALKLCANLCLFWLCGSLAHTCWAAGGDSVKLPLPGVTYPRSSGLQIQFDLNWVEGPGYRPVVVHVTCVAPAKADRYLTMSIAPSDLSYREAVEFELKIPEGARSVRQEIAVPQIGIWHQLRIDVFENGRRLDDLSERVGVSRSGTGWNWTEAYPSMLFIDADAPQLSEINSVVSMQRSGLHQLPDILAFSAFIDPATNSEHSLITTTRAARKTVEGRLRSDDGLICSTVPKLAKVAMLPFSELPEQWLNYTCLDMTFISLEDLRKLIQQRPKSWSAIFRYVAAGGNLVVYGLEADFAQLAELNALLQDSQPPTDDQHMPIGTEDWRAPRAASYGRTLQELASPDNTVLSFNSVGRVREEILEDEDEEDADGVRRRFVTVPDYSRLRLRDLGWGRVLAVAADDLSEVPDAQWAWGLNDLDPNRIRWYRRHGVSLRRPNPSFWEFLIPGVGAAPVTAFLGIITMFVIVIGPVNYLLLHRSRRLYLLLVTVPLAAVLIVGGLIGFAMVKDGLGTRARLRSFSRIMPDGHVVSWSWQSYYAGLAPSSGLVYPKEAAVFPIEFDPQRQEGRRRLLRWHDAQQLAAGFLTARSTSQQLVINVTEGKSPVRLTRDSNASPEVTNQGSTLIDHVLIIDADDMFWIDRLSPGETRSAMVFKSADLKRRYAELLANHRPALPPGFTPPRDRQSYRYGYYNNADNGISGPNMETNLIEQAFAEMTELTVSAGRVYFAIKTQAPDFVPVGVAGCRQEAGFHVIRGSW